VSVEKIKPRMLTHNNSINWVPNHIQQGRFGKWLENARDWAISRNRFWGNPLPIWRCDEEGCDHEICVGSRDELKELSGTRPEDLHKHFVDQITWNCTCGKGTMRRIPEVLDCWFESGAMPYGQVHYPFENKRKFDAHFPADFINEGLDQTRGWFYTLHILSSALMDRPAFQNCVVSGLVLANDGKKMSKSLRNYSDPYEVMKKHGADALRLFLMSGPVTKADDLRYSDDGVQAVLRDVLLPLWNSYSFFVTYANLDPIARNDMDVIDVLPFNGDGTAVGDVPGRNPGSNFHGRVVLKEVDVEDGETVRYTDAPPASVYALYDPSNGAPGHTALPAGKAWCTASQIAANGAGCPSSLGASTAIRVTRNGPLAAHEDRRFTYTIETVGNRSGDLYSNTAPLARALHRSTYSVFLVTKYTDLNSPCT
jgi:hypothetical protein